MTTPTHQDTHASTPLEPDAYPRRPAHLDAPDPRRRYLRGQQHIRLMTSIPKKNAPLKGRCGGGVFCLLKTKIKIRIGAGNTIATDERMICFANFFIVKRDGNINEVLAGA